MTRAFKYIFALFFLALVITAGSPVSYALTYSCDNISANVVAGEAPSPLAVVCILARVINLAVLIVGIVFVAVVAYSAFKLSMALGDPKGMAASRQTWLYAVIGALVVVGFFGLFMIIGNIVGVGTIISPNALLNRIEAALIGLIGSANITNFQ